MLMIKDHVLLPVLASIGEHNFIKRANGTYAKLGITILRNYDGIYYLAKLPEGWRVDETEMGYDVLVDSENEIKGKIVYERKDTGDIKYAIFEEVK